MPRCSADKLYLKFLCGGELCCCLLFHLDYELASEHLLKRGQVLLHTPDFDLTVMRCVYMQCHVLRIDNTQACALDEARMAAVQILCQAEQRT